MQGGKGSVPEQEQPSPAPRCRGVRGGVSAPKWELGVLPAPSPRSSEAVLPSQAARPLSEHVELAVPDKGMQALSRLPPLPPLPASLPCWLSSPLGQGGIRRAAPLGGKDGEHPRSPQTQRQGTPILQTACAQPANRSLGSAARAHAAPGGSPPPPQQSPRVLGIQAPHASR